MDLPVPVLKLKYRFSYVGFQSIEGTDNKIKSVMDLLVLYAFLKDHKADTLTEVVETVEAFAKENNTENANFLLAAGSAGIEAASVARRSITRWAGSTSPVSLRTSLSCAIAQASSNLVETNHRLIQAQSTSLARRMLSTADS